MRVVKGPEDYADTEGMRRIEKLYDSIKDMEVIYIDDLREVISEFEDIAECYPYYVMPIEGGTSDMDEMDAKELWNEFKDYLNYCWDRMNPGRIVYLGNLLWELQMRLEKADRRV